MSSQPGPARSSNVDLITLAIAAVASGVAAFVTSKVWTGGTLISAAMTPVIVALVKEGIARPVDVTTRRVRDLTTGKTMEVEVPVEDDFDPLAPPAPPPGTEPGITLHRETRARKPWKIALITGLLAFAIAAVVITVPQVIANASGGGGGGGGTTYFGGGSKRKDSKQQDGSKDATPTPAPDATRTAAPEATQTPEPDATEEATPSATPTPTPTVTVTPTPSATAAP